MSAGRSILFVAHTGQVSGAEKVLLNLVEESLKTGSRVSVACPQGPLADLLPSAVVHVPIPSLGLAGERRAARAVGIARLLCRWWAAARTLAAMVRDPSTSTVVNSLFALPAVRLARPPSGFAWLVHDTMNSTKQQAVTRMGRKGIRIAVAMSEASAAPLRALGIPARVTPQGVRWPVPRLRNELRSPPVVGMLALLTPWKGHRVLLEAVAILDGVELELAGGCFPSDEGYLAELLKRAAQPDLANRVRFLGHVDSEGALSRWDAVVSASIDPEAAPLSVLEAMSFGLAVIGTDHGGTSEFLRHGAGLLVPPGDAPALANAIRSVLSDSRLRDTIAGAARRRIAGEHDISVTLPLMLHALLNPPG